MNAQFTPMGGLLSRLEDRLLPGHCHLCLARTSALLCTPCLAQLPRAGFTCRQCALPLKAEGLCPECQKHPPDFDQVRAHWVYNYPLDYLILRFKHHEQIPLGRFLAQQALPTLPNRQDQMPDIITAMPLHWRRQVLRGFNQAIEIAGVYRTALHRAGLHALWQPALLRKVRHTHSQQGLTRRQRQRNLQSSLQVTDDVGGKKVAVIDDVVTTGATARALGTLLKKAGAARVDIWALARTPKIRSL